MAKSDKTTVRKRVEEVLALRLLGADFSDIRKYANEPNPEEGREPWDVSDSQIRRYIRMGDEYLARTIDKDRERLINRHIAQRRALYARAMATSDYGTCRQLLKDEAELLNLYPAKRHEFTGADGGPIETLNAAVEVTDDERANAITSILTRVGKGDAGSDPDGKSNGP